MRCKICELEFESKRSLASHLQQVHSLKTKEYTYKLLLELKSEPVCARKNCNSEVRYVSFTFKKYCKEHAKLSMSEAGRTGGKSEAWNKGKTKGTSQILYEQSEAVKGISNHFHGKKHTRKSKDKMKISSVLTERMFDERVVARKTEFECLTMYSDYTSRQYQYLNFICCICKSVNQKTMQAFERGSQCEKCFPKPSKPEQEVAEFIKAFIPAVLTSDRTLIGPKELDIYVPSKNFAVEFNGLYWHTTDFVTKKYHREKTEACAVKGVQLFHIFSDEWQDKPQIVKSMIRHRLGVTPRRIFARKCEVREVPNNESREFFEQTHIAGKTRYKKAFGLYYQDELVSCISVKKPIQKKHGDNVLEISRFASALNTVVVGGFQKIFKRVLQYARGEKYEKILTYADRRFSEGLTYKKAGFTQLKPTNTGYFYTDGKVRHFRFKFRAQQPTLENGMIRLTENQVAINNGVAQIHDCGHNVYLLHL